MDYLYGAAKRRDDEWTRAARDGAETIAASLLKPANIGKGSRLEMVEVTAKDAPLGLFENAKPLTLGNSTRSGWMPTVDIGTTDLPTLPRRS